MQDRESPLVANLERQLGRKLTPEEHHLITLTEPLDEGIINGPQNKIDRS